MITPTQYTRTYEAAQEMLRDEAQRIARSSDTRSWLMKNIGKAPDQEVIKRAVECIADLTGDTTLRKRVDDDLPRVCQDTYSYREPVPNIYISTVDVGAPMLECPGCKARIQANAFSYAVGNMGYQFCPYCGKDVRKKVNP